MFLRCTHCLNTKDSNMNFDVCENLKILYGLRLSALLVTYNDGVSFMFRCQLEDEFQMKRQDMTCYLNLLAYVLCVPVSVPWVGLNPTGNRI
jgi:hypothetical protein